jgi:hypothetical protein
MRRFATFAVATAGYATNREANAFWCGRSGARFTTCAKPIAIVTLEITAPANPRSKADWDVGLVAFLFA